MSKLIRFLLLNLEQYGHLTKIIKAPDSLQSAQFLKCLSRDRAAAKEILLEKILINYF